MILTLEEAKLYIRLDDEYYDSYVIDLIETSQIYIDSMVGTAYKTYPDAVKLATLLQKKLISDMYDNRGTEIPSNIQQDKITNSILDKLSNYYIETIT
jgi:uncharacterized phage protein (predicted DNA packaging)